MQKATVHGRNEKGVVCRIIQSNYTYLLLMKRIFTHTHNHSLSNFDCKLKFLLQANYMRTIHIHFILRVYA